MKHLSKLIETYLMPLSQKLSSNKYLVALRDGLMLSMPLLIVGSLAIVIGDFPVPAFHEFMTSIVGDVWNTWCWDMVNPATMGLVALFAVVGVSHSLASEEEVEPLPAVAISISAYFLLLQQMDGGGYATSSFDSAGLFTAMLTALIATKLYAVLLKKDIKIKMPSTVPGFVTRQFEALIPATLIVILFLILRLIFEATPYGTVSNFIVTVIQMPLTNIGTTFIGTIFITVLNSILWFFGIHGTAVIDSFMGPLWYAARFANLDIFQTTADAVRPYIATQDFANLIIFLGGTGNTVSLALIMAFKCKSKRLKSLGKLSFLPGIFNVNEPVIFGLPLVLNPMMAIPFFIVPLVTVGISFAAMFFGLVPYPTGVTVPWTMPAPFGGWMMCADIRGGILQLIVLVIGGLIYYPFINALDQQYLKEESAEAQTELKE
ncbi:MAG: PTS sugar transporter subunit IIC [Lachnospiraceae bacterium]|nr:PTS sugar transporter subunit IIC [Clostridiaceae bacterium Marseille-Q4145]MDY3825408.1 PTS sugar transporter subunit IIC [Lachnospiraceae bacterium]QUO20879.1 PTS sugar transporter subunit IIC [Clostridiaceae bacterium Marseille-Q4143]RHU83251.1 PTS sugar transporter subunit IIC [Clostridiaceae bacterium OM08-6BH]